MSSSQLTFIFIRGVGQPPTSFLSPVFPRVFPMAKWMNHGGISHEKTWKTIIIITLEHPKKSIWVESPMAIPQRRDARHLCQSAMERWEKKGWGTDRCCFWKAFFLRVFTYHICLTCIYIYVCIMYIYIYMYVYIFLLSIYWFIYSIYIYIYHKCNT